ncbi:MAG: hypothetical protein L6R38_004639 [Xanthoria sp. 2 TBL-2021]|nr:MAG: hypothetical protein L6R38_004639 [Xanthoria sp. 2 TBL-2021]
MASNVITAEEKPEDRSPHNINDEILYSTFSKTSKRWISVAASFSAMFSGLSSFIYYPAVTPIAEDLHTSIELVNLTITSYLIVSGLAPSIIGDLADRTGRRPLYIATFTIYFAANIGLALQDSYAALFTLRMLQSAGSSGTITLAYGVLADIAPPAERGWYVGVLMGFTNTAPSLGPILGGVVAQRLGWRWIFWLLAILSGCQLLSMTLFFPETARKVVGNGSLSPRGLNKTMGDYLRSRRIPVTTPGLTAPRNSFYWPNPLAGLSIVLDKKSALTMVIGGIFYTVFSCLAASLSTICIDLYDLNYLEAGLIYLPAGIGGILAAYSTGRLLDHDYRRTAKKYGIEINRLSGDDMSAFPIEEARLRSSWLPALTSIIAAIGYGWALQTTTHIAVPLTLQFFTGGTMVALFTMCGTLLTDLNQETPASAQAAYNLIRCALAAAGIAALDPIIDALDVGWCFTLYAGVCLGTLPLVVVLRRLGNQWRSSSQIDP